jgi:hypothetical protein
MMSLKAFAPVLAVALGTTPAAIYERQRALIREKLLPAPTGRGRGHGLPATPETVAMIIIAMMATDNLSDTDNRVRKLAKAKVNESLQSRNSKRPDTRAPALTGKRNFKSALVALLSAKWLGDGIVQVSRKDLHVKIIHTVDDLIRLTRFARVGGVAGHLEVAATIHFSVLEKIGKALGSDEADSRAKSKKA